MSPETFKEKTVKLFKLLTPKGCAYGGPFILAGAAGNVAFFTIVIPEGKNLFRETVHAIWSGGNGNLQQEEVLSLIGFFKTSLDARIEGGYILLNVLCEDGDFSREFNFRIPRDIIGEWCRRERPDKEIIIN